MAPRLFEVPRGSRIRCRLDDGTTGVVFERLDGMYSICRPASGGPGYCHLYAATPLVALDDDPDFDFAIEGSSDEEEER